MSGYVIESPEEIQRILRAVGYYTTFGLTCAYNIEQKQFFLERILLELAMPLQHLRDKNPDMVIGEMPDVWPDVVEKLRKMGELE